MLKPFKIWWHHLSCPKEFTAIKLWLERIKNTEDTEFHDDFFEYLGPYPNSILDASKPWYDCAEKYQGCEMKWVKFENEKWWLVPVEC